MSLKDVPVRARLWAPDRSLPRFFGRLLLFFVRFNLTSFAQYPRATKMYGGVAQARRAAPSGDDKARKRCPREPCCTLGQREGAEESPDCAARHLRVRDSQASSFPESPAPSPAPVVGWVQVAGCMVVRPLYPAYSFDIWKFLLFLS